MKHLGRWLVLLGGTVLLIFCASNTDALLLRLVPKMVLQEALPEAVELLQKRFADDPLGIIARTLEKDGKYTVEGSIDLSSKFLGTVQVDGILQTNAREHQFLIDGIASASQQSLNLSLYVDSDFISVSSQNLTEGTYYGITYDTFASDIRNVPLLNMFISDGVFSRWEASLQEFRESFNQDWPLPYLPELSEEEEDNLLLGLLALPCKTENRTVTLADTPLQCRSLTYIIEEEKLKNLPIELPEELKVLELSFYLSEGALVFLHCSLEYGQEYSQWSLFLGRDPSQDPLTLTVSGTGSSLVTVSVSNSQQNKQCWEILAKGERVSISWDREREILTLGQDRETPSVLLFQETDSGFRLKTENLYQFWQRASLQETIWQPVACDLFILKGSAIQTPEYKNLSTWTLEDFLLLAEGIGTWFGLHFD